MASIGDVKRKLPQKFIDNLYDEFSSGSADKILMGMAADRSTTLRVNTIKYNRKYLQANRNIDCDYKNGVK